MTAPGGVPASGLDTGVAEHYGGPMAEQRRLATGPAVVDVSNRGTVTVTGPDRLTWLDSLLSQRVVDLTPEDDSREALLLDPRGRVEHHMVVWDDGGTTWLGTEPGGAPDLAGFLDSMRFMLRVEVADVTRSWATVVLVGADADAPGVQRRRRRWPDDSWDLTVRRDDLASLWPRWVDSGVRPVGIQAWEALRVASVEARQGRETDARTIPQELGWDRSAVHLAKGCYRGQETVARVHALGRAPRRLVMVHLDGMSEELPPPGSPIRAAERDVGFLGTVARHYELGPIALAVVKSSVATDAELTVVVEDGAVAAAIDPASERGQAPGSGQGRAAQQGLRRPGA